MTPIGKKVPPVPEVLNKIVHATAVKIVPKIGTNFARSLQPGYFTWPVGWVYKQSYLAWSIERHQHASARVGDYNICASCIVSKFVSGTSKRTPEQFGVPMSFDRTIYNSSRFCWYHYAVACAMSTRLSVLVSCSAPCPAITHVSLACGSVLLSA